MTTVPFTPLEEAVFYIERKHDPWNVHLEVETTTRLEADRLRDAALVACNVHPLARARMQAHSGLDQRRHWEIPDTIDDVPSGTVEVVEHLDAARTSAFYREPLDLTTEPPFELLVDRGGGREGGDRLLVSISHVAADGIGGARFVRSLCRAYLGDPLEADSVDLGTARSVITDASPPSPRTGLDLLGDAVEYLGNTVDPPARIAEDGGDDRADGWVFEYRRLDDDLTDRLMTDRPDGSSVNDVLLAGLHRCIDAWNRGHGESAGKISLMMPLNLRPTAWFYDVVGMFAAFDSITTRRRVRRTPRRTLEAVTEQTRRLKGRERTTVPYEALKLVPPGTPVGLKERFPELLKGPGQRFVDTAVLSNLGRIPDPLPRLAADDEPNVWFSPPSFAPGPVGIGVATVDGTVSVAGRYARDTFDADAAAAFTDRFLDAVGECIA